MAKQPKPQTTTDNLAPATSGGEGTPPSPFGSPEAVAALLGALSGGHTRALLVTHPPAEGQTYDNGRRYQLRLLEAKDGQVTVREVVEVGEGEQTLSMPFHVLNSHMEREVATFIKPEMFR